MTVLVVPYDTGWPRRFEAEAKRLHRALGSIVLEIAHVGSTAVPGISAKPTIDIAVGVARLDDVRDGAVAVLEKMGYVHRGEAGVPGRRYFRKGEVYPRDYHVSIVEWRGPLWTDYLLLRDYLCARPDEAASYVEAKRAAERQSGGADPITYWEYKRAFVEELLARARAGQV